MKVFKSQGAGNRFLVSFWFNFFGDARAGESYADVFAGYGFEITACAISGETTGVRCLT